MNQENMLMCRSCGCFIEVLNIGDENSPWKEECPECGGTEFKDNDTGEL